MNQNNNNIGLPCTEAYYYEITMAKQHLKELCSGCIIRVIIHSIYA